MAEGVQGSVGEDEGGDVLVVGRVGGQALEARNCPGQVVQAVACHVEQHLKWEVRGGD